MLSPRKTTVSPSRSANSPCAGPVKANPNQKTARAVRRPGCARFIDIAPSSREESRHAKMPFQAAWCHRILGSTDFPLPPGRNQPCRRTRQCRSPAESGPSHESTELPRGVGPRLGLRGFRGHIAGGARRRSQGDGRFGRSFLGLQAEDRLGLRRGRAGDPDVPRPGGPAGRAVRCRAAAGEPRGLLLRREGGRLRRRDVPPGCGRDGHPQPHELARRRPGEPDRRRPPGDVPQVPGGRVRQVFRRARASPPGRRPRRRRPRRCIDRLRRRLQRPGRRHRRRRPGPQGGRLVRLHPLAVEAPRQRRRRPRRPPRAVTPGIWRARRLPRARPARPEARARRQAVFQHRRPRVQRHHARQPQAVRPRHRLGPPLQPRRHRVGGLRHGTPQPAGAGLRRVRQPVHRRQQLRQRRPGAVGLPRRGGRQRLADRLPVHRRAGQPRPVERGEAVAPGVRRSGGVHRAADREYRRRSVGPGLRARRQPAAGRLSQAFFPRRLPRRRRAERHPLVRAAAEGGVVRADRCEAVHLEYAGH